MPYVYQKTNYYALFGDAVFFFLMMFWPAMKTLVVLDEKKKFLGRWSIYWMGLPPFLAIFYTLRFIFNRWSFFPLVQIFVGFVCSYGNGAFIQRFAVAIVSPFYKKHNSDLKSLPDQFGNILSNIGKALGRVLMDRFRGPSNNASAHNLRPPTNRVSDDDDDDNE